MWALQLTQKNGLPILVLSTSIGSVRPAIRQKPGTGIMTETGSVPYEAEPHPEGGCYLFPVPGNDEDAIGVRESYDEVVALIREALL
jgi:hypothetical protein